jgi:GNAT superfamily N-acetyltransferase
MTTLISVGKILYISDLVTKSSYQKQGHAKKLIQYVSKFAKDNGCIKVGARQYLPQFGIRKSEKAE